MKKNTTTCKETTSRLIKTHIIYYRWPCQIWLASSLVLSLSNYPKHKNHKVNLRVLSEEDKTGFSFQQIPRTWQLHHRLSRNWNWIPTQKVGFILKLSETSPLPCPCASFPQIVSPCNSVLVILFFNNFSCFVHWSDLTLDVSFPLCIGFLLLFAFWSWIWNFGKYLEWKLARLCYICFLVGWYWIFVRIYLFMQQSLFLKSYVQLKWK